jgi:hypothetical protein
MKWKHHIIGCASRANVMLGKLKRSFKNINEKSFKKLYTAFVRPHMEFAVPVWSPYLKSDIETLVKVQRRAIKWVTFKKACHIVKKSEQLVFSR